MKDYLRVEWAELTLEVLTIADIADDMVEFVCQSQCFEETRGRVWR
jgi:hypothetical protein